MILFIRDIPETVNHKNLCDFVSKGLHHVWGKPLFNKGKIERCDVLRIKDLDNNHVEYHGLAFIDNDKTAKALMKQLNRSKLNGKKVDVRKFRIRTPDLDSRRSYTSTQNLAFIDRRRRDRRRPNLLLETLYRPRPANLLAG